MIKDLRKLVLYLLDLRKGLIVEKDLIEIDVVMSQQQVDEVVLWEEVVWN